VERNVTTKQRAPPSRRHTEEAREASTTHLLEEGRMTDGVTYTTKNLTEWNENRRGEIELDALARVYLGDAEITTATASYSPCVSFASRGTTWRRARSIGRSR